MIEAYKGLDEHYEQRVITDFTHAHYKPGQKVKWLAAHERCEGVIIGGYAADAFPTGTWVVLYKGHALEVDEIALMHEWEEPPPTPPAYTESELTGQANLQPNTEDEIPF